jgi:hypothetical protein
VKATSTLEVVRPQFRFKDGPWLQNVYLHSVHIPAKGHGRARIVDTWYVAEKDSRTYRPHATSAAHPFDPRLEVQKFLETGRDYLFFVSIRSLTDADVTSLKPESCSRRVAIPKGAGPQYIVELEKPAQPDDSQPGVSHLGFHPLYLGAGWREGELGGSRWHRFYIPSCRGGELHIALSAGKAELKYEEWTKPATSAHRVAYGDIVGHARRPTLVVIPPERHGWYWLYVKEAHRYQVAVDFDEVGYAREADGRTPFVPWNFHWFSHKRSWSFKGARSPLRKYGDAFVSADPEAPARWEKDHHYEPKKPSWTGHCHGAAPATVYLKPPVARSVANSHGRGKPIPFEAHEVGLFAAEWGLHHQGSPEASWLLERHLKLPMAVDEKSKAVSGLSLLRGVKLTRGGVVGPSGRPPTWKSLFAAFVGKTGDLRPTVEAQRRVALLLHAFSVKYKDVDADDTPPEELATFELNNKRLTELNNQSVEIGGPFLRGLEKLARALEPNAEAIITRARQRAEAAKAQQERERPGVIVQHQAEHALFLLDDLEATGDKKLGEALERHLGQAVAELHVFVGEQQGKGGHCLVGDLRGDDVTSVWNHAVYHYRARLRQAYGVHADPATKRRLPLDEKVVEVETRLYANSDFDIVGDDGGLASPWRVGSTSAIPISSTLDHKHQRMGEDGEQVILDIFRSDARGRLVKPYGGKPEKRNVAEPEIRVLDYRLEFDAAGKVSTSSAHSRWRTCASRKGANGYAVAALRVYGPPRGQAREGSGGNEHVKAADLFASGLLELNDGY